MATSKGFIFNLLTPKSEEEIKKEETRDSSSVYTAILPLIGAVIWVAIVLANSLLVQSYITTWKQKIVTQNLEIGTFTDDREQNGELYLKTQALSEVITKNIDPEEFFEVVEGTLFSISPDINIRSYGRQEGGQFDINASTDSFIDVAKVMNAFTSDDAYANVTLNSATRDSATGDVNFSLNLEFVGQGN